MIKNKKQKEEVKTFSVKITIDLGLVIAPDEYKNKIEELFFNEMKQEMKCFNDTNKSYIFYWCDKSSENDIKNNFHTLYFYMQLYYKTFELTYKDLFIEKN